MTPNQIPDQSVASEAMQIAESLTKAQRAAIVAATVHAPPSILPDYHPMEMRPCGMTATEAEYLVALNLVTLPVRVGDRSTTVEYHGEMRPLGLAVRNHLIQMDSAK